MFSRLFKPLKNPINHLATAAVVMQFAPKINAEFIDLDPENDYDIASTAEALEACTNSTACISIAASVLLTICIATIISHRCRSQYRANPANNVEQRQPAEEEIETPYTAMRHV